MGCVVSVRRLYYIACDVCGLPHGDDEQMTDTAREARLAIKAAPGWAHMTADNRRLDLCPTCAKTRRATP